MAIARFVRFQHKTKVLDVGTGGGFPGIPLAILFPETSFILTDSISKKIRVVAEISKELDLINVFTRNERIEQSDVNPDFITGRAVSSIDRFYELTKRLITPGKTGSVRNGILYLGGGVVDEAFTKKTKAQIIPLSDYFKEPYFQTKTLIYIPKL
jgi:16S rRNA (guanine527-N7)-methyltransferase